MYRVITFTSLTRSNVRSPVQSCQRGTRKTYLDNISRRGVILFFFSKDFSLFPRLLSSTWTLQILSVCKDVDFLVSLHLYM